MFGHVGPAELEQAPGGGDEDERASFLIYAKNIVAFDADGFDGCLALEAAGEA